MHIFLIFCIFENVNAKSYKIGDKISDELEFYKKYKFELPSGTWTIADRFRYSYYGATAKGYKLLKIKGNKAILFCLLATSKDDAIDKLPKRIE